MTAGFLLAAIQITPVFFLGLLAALLLVSRPNTTRERIWIAVSVAALIAWLRGPSNLADQTVHASAAFFIGAFVSLTLLGVRSLFVRAIAAVAIGALAMIGWYLVFHLRFVDLQNEIITETWEAWRKLVNGLPAAVPSAEALEEGGVSDIARKYATGITIGAFLFPAWIALSALAGARLTWSWYQRLAHSPILPPAGPLREFRFNDHLIWLLVVLIAALLLPVPEAVRLVAANALAVVAALYALRGAAIAQRSLVRASPVFITVLLLIMLPLIYLVFIALVGLGIADTWLDFRRRAAPPSGAST